MRVIPLKEKKSDHFQVHLDGIMNLLSNHLYSAPKVYIRELLQNAVDAITARNELEPGLEGTIQIQVLDGERPSLIFEDNGIGLTEEEVYLFLTNIGASSKRGQEREGFIGQFGIGLLACFMLADEIVMVTRSARGGPALEWKGRFDGTFTTRVLEGDHAPGTRVYLQAKPGAEALLRPAKVEELARHYGDLLPYAVLFSGEDGVARQINSGQAPFEAHSCPEEVLLAYGREQFGTEFLAAIPLRTSDDKTTGVAYVLKATPGLAHKPQHRVYLKRMLLSEKNTGILPNWAFFVQAIVNSSELKPTASREEIYQDETLEKVRKQMGRCIRNYLMKLHREFPDMLMHIIERHRLAIKMMAMDDSEFMRIIFPYLRFQTNYGEMTIREYRTYSDTLYHMSDEQAFEQVRVVAACQGLPLINSFYDFDMELLRKFHEAYYGMTVKEVNAQFVIDRLGMPSEAEQTAMELLLQEAEAELQPFHCQIVLRKFDPAQVPVLYHMDASLSTLRRSERMRNAALHKWGIILQTDAANVGKATLCLNITNPLLQQMAQVQDPKALRPFLRLLYLQALLLGNHPLTSAELHLLTEGFGHLLQIQLSGEKQKKVGRGGRWWELF